ncbi:PREDICTED: cystatin-12-like [Chinchilla lanigera]|nr:PREDICTED: cystatin-12-like [Chinchilla lanigera]
MLRKVSLLVGLLMWGTFSSLDKFVYVDKNLKAFVMSVEHVVFKFNEAQEDPFLYKVLRIWRSKRQFSTETYLIDLEMGRTMCKKQDDDLDNCLLQQEIGRRKVRCTYFVRTLEWITQFSIVNSTCDQI